MGTTDAYPCSFCGRDQHTYSRAVGGPSDILICDYCLAECQQLAEGLVSLLFYKVDRETARCSFCGLSASESSAVFGMRGCAPMICQACLDLCRPLDRR